MFLLKADESRFGGRRHPTAPFGARRIPAGSANELHDGRTRGAPAPKRCHPIGGDQTAPIEFQSNALTLSPPVVINWRMERVKSRLDRPSNPLDNAAQLSSGAEPFF
jgi:hypothetical protein